MQITSYAHSCLLIEAAGKRILVDPGEYSVENANKWKNIDYVFVTHKHGDHFDEAVVTKTIPKGTPIYATKETAAFYPKTNFTIIKESQLLDFGGVKVEVVRAIHGYNPLLKGEKEVHGAIGFVFDDGKRTYVTGDTICFPNNYKCDVLFLPVNNHGVCMGPFEAALFAKETGAQIVCPYHLNSPKFPADLKKVEEEFKKAGINYKILKAGEKIEV